MIMTCINKQMTYREGGDSGFYVVVVGVDSHPGVLHRIERNTNLRRPSDVLLPSCACGHPTPNPFWPKGGEVQFHYAA